MGAVDMAKIDAKKKDRKKERKPSELAWFRKLPCNGCPLGAPGYKGATQITPRVWCNGQWVLEPKAAICAWKRFPALTALFHGQKPVRFTDALEDLENSK